MKRRDFLKGLTALGVAQVLPLSEAVAFTVDTGIRFTYEVEGNIMGIISCINRIWANGQLIWEKDEYVGRGEGEVRSDGAQREPLQLKEQSLRITYGATLDAAKAQQEADVVLPVRVWGRAYCSSRLLVAPSQPEDALRLQESRPTDVAPGGVSYPQFHAEEV